MRLASYVKLSTAVPILFRFALRVAQQNKWQVLTTSSGSRKKVNIPGTGGEAGERGRKKDQTGNEDMELTIFEVEARSMA